MPGPIVHFGATVMCSHGGQAIPTSVSPRVMVSGMPVVTIASTYTIAGCALSGSGGPFDVTGQWVAGATRVFATGVPVVLALSQSVCAATGNPMLVVSTQLRVTGT